MCCPLCWVAGRWSWRLHWVKNFWLSSPSHLDRNKQRIKILCKSWMSHLESLTELPPIPQQLQSRERSVFQCWWNSFTRTWISWNTPINRLHVMYSLENLLSMSSFIRQHQADALRRRSHTDSNWGFVCQICRTLQKNSSCWQSRWFHSAFATHTVLRLWHGGATYLIHTAKSCYMMYMMSPDVGWMNADWYKSTRLCFSGKISHISPAVSKLFSPTTFKPTK